MSMTATFILSLAFLAGLGCLIWLIISFLRSRHISLRGVAALAVCALDISACIWYFAPRRLKGYDADIIQQSVSWYCVDNAVVQPVCVQPRRLPDGLQIRRYRLGDSPMPNNPVSTRAVGFEMTLSDGKTVIIVLCPDRPASSRIWFYDEPYGVSSWFLTKQSAERCLDAFLQDPV